MENPDRAAVAWGSGAALPPSVERVDPLGWLAASAVVGAVAAIAALLLVWRPIPGFGTPPGSLGAHAMHWAAMAAHALSERLFASQAAEYADFFLALTDEQKRGLIYRCAFAIWAALMPFPMLAGSLLRPRSGLIEFGGPAAIKAPRRELIWPRRSKAE